MKKYYKIAVFIIPFLFLLALNTQAAQTTFYVSPSGNDSNPGTKSQPLKTIDKAKQKVRNLLNSGQTSDITVFIRGGNYYIDSTISFTNEDSGDGNQTITYKNYQGEEPVLIGGKRITNWENHAGNISKANVGKGWKFYVLMENNRLATMAREPNNGYLRVKDTDEVPCHNCGSDYIFEYHDGDISQFDHSDAQIYSKSGAAGRGSHMEWVTEISPIRDINYNSHELTINKPSKWMLLEKDDRYHLRGSLDFLDKRGEYYLDQSAGFLYYWPKNDPIENQTIIAPKVDRIFELEGNSLTNRISNIHFEGLTLMLTNGPGQFSYNNTNNDAAIYLKNADHIVIKDCHFANLGLNAISLEKACQNNKITGNLIEDYGQRAVWLNNDLDEHDDRYINKNNIISNNWIRYGYQERRDGTTLFLGPTNHGGNTAAINLSNSGDNIISHNRIEHVPYAGIALGSAKPDDLHKEKEQCPGCFKYLHNHDNNISYNYISYCMEDANDGGGIYNFGGGKGNLADHNLIHDCISGVPDAPQGEGIYLDEGSSGWTITNNIVFNINGGYKSVDLIGKGCWHQISNNIFGDSQGNWLQGHSSESFINIGKGTPGCNSYTVEKNIFVTKKDGYYMYYGSFGGSGINRTFNNNIFWHPGGKYLVYFKNGDISLSDWRAKGFDKNSKTEDPKLN